MLNTIKHSYACRILRDKKLRIRCGNREILAQFYHKSYPELNTFMQVGYNYQRDYMEKKQERITNYDDLNRMGWKISSASSTGEFFAYQRVRYYLARITKEVVDYGSMPKDHFVLVNHESNQIKLVGPNVSLTGDSGWISLYKAKTSSIAKNSPFDIDKIHTSAETYLQKILPTELRTGKTIEVKNTPGAVVGITSKGDICTLDMEENEAPVIAIAGQRGSGKSILENTLEGQFYHKLNTNIFHFNDIKYDTQTRCLEWEEDHPFMRELKMFGEGTIPLPYVYLHPSMKGLKESDVIYKDEVGFVVSFPFKDFLLDADLMRYNKQWKISQASRKYIRNLIEDNHGTPKPDGLLYCHDLEQAKNIINNPSNIPDELATLRVSLFNLIKDVWSRNILDKTSGIPSKWVVTIGDTEYACTPWNACLLCGVIPSFITAYARKQDWYPMEVKHILDDVFKFVQTKEYKKIQGKKLMLCGDELTQILREKETRGIIDQVIGEGRTLDTGFMLCVQNYNEVPDSIITNITHQFVFNTKSKSTLSYLKQEYDLSSSEQKRFGRFKKFECMAFGNFILYDNHGNKYSNDREPVKIIKVKYPNAQHYKGVQS